MDKTTNRPVVIGLTVLGAIARFLPHPPNFTPVGGVSLFAGARLNGWLAWVLPLALMILTDASNYRGPGWIDLRFSGSTPFVYAAFLINVLIGRLMLRQSASPLKIGGAAFACSLQFFLVSNLGPWIAGYPLTFAGLAACYTAAIPFFGYTVAADLMYSGVLFGAHALAARALRTDARAAA